MSKEKFTDIWIEWKQPTKTTKTDFIMLADIKSKFDVLVERARGTVSKEEKDELVKESFRIFLTFISESKHKDAVWVKNKPLTVINQYFDTIISIIKDEQQSSRESITDRAKREARNEILRSKV